MSILKELIQNINQCPDPKGYDWAELSDFSGLCSSVGYLGWDAFEEFATRVKCYWINKWMCTDTMVGTAVYFMDGEPVAVSHQRGRKSNKDVLFVSLEAANKVSAYVYELLIKHNDISIQLVDMGQEIPLDTDGGYRFELKGVEE